MRNFPLLPEPLDFRPLLEPAQSCPPSIGADDAHALLAVFIPEPQFGGGKQAIDDHPVLPDPVIDQFRPAIGPQHKEWRQFPLPDPGRERDIDLVAVIEGPAGQPGGHSAFHTLDRVAEIQRVEI